MNHFKKIGVIGFSVVAASSYAQEVNLVPTPASNPSSYTSNFEGLMGPGFNQYRPGVPLSAQWPTYSFTGSQNYEVFPAFNTPSEASIWSSLWGFNSASVPDLVPPAIVSAPSQAPVVEAAPAPAPEAAPVVHARALASAPTATPTSASVSPDSSSPFPTAPVTEKGFAVPAPVTATPLSPPLPVGTPAALHATAVQANNLPSISTPLQPAALSCLPPPVPNSVLAAQSDQASQPSAAPAPSSCADPLKPSSTTTLTPDTAVNLALAEPLKFVGRGMMGNEDIPGCAFRNSQVYVVYDYCTRGAAGEVGVTIYTADGQSVHIHVASTSENGQDAHRNVADASLYSQGYPPNWTLYVELNAPNGRSPDPSSFKQIAAHEKLDKNMVCNVDRDGIYNHDADCGGNASLTQNWLPAAQRFAAAPSAGWFELLGKLHKLAP
ncbi:MAG: hypothetical protein P4M08_10635 [Oligoflexia bacterium]|nr:hypothetical protein [Oligoflexia bacterium]